MQKLRERTRQALEKRDPTKKLRRELGRLVKEYGREEVLKALAQPVGHPRINDRKAINNMYKLMRSGEAKTPSEAARLSLHLTRSKTATAGERRLRDKFNQQNKRLAETARIVGVQAMEQFASELAGQTKKLADAREAMMAPFNRMAEEWAEATSGLFSGGIPSGLSPEENDDENSGENHSD